MNVLLVCTGNICRSPMAEGVLRHLVEEAGLADRITIDSAGTHGFHAGKAPEPKAQAEAAANGLDISGLVSREVTRADLEHEGLVLAMDRQNLNHLQYLAPPGRRESIRLFTSFAYRKPRDVPDPYGRSEKHFSKAMKIIDEAAHAVLTHLRATVSS